MNNTIKISMAVFILAILQACRPVIHNSGPLVTEERELSEFNKLTLSGSMDIVLTEDSGYSIIVEAGERKLHYIETKVVNGRLIVEETRNRVPDNKGITVFVSGQVLEEISLLGSGDITGDELVLGNLNIEIEGSGNVKTGLVAEEVFIQTQGSGDVELDGWAESLTFDVDGSGDLKARNFETEYCSISVFGSGDSWVHVTDSLHVNIFGSGDVYYKGNPDTIIANIQGSGEIIQIN